MVAGRVEVGKGYGSADGNHRHERVELHVALLDPVGPCGGGRDAGRPT